MLMKSFDVDWHNATDLDVRTSMKSWERRQHHQCEKYSTCRSKCQESMTSVIRDRWQYIYPALDKPRILSIFVESLYNYFCLTFRSRTFVFPVSSRYLPCHSGIMLESTRKKIVAKNFEHRTRVQPKQPRLDDWKGDKTTGHITVAQSPVRQRKYLHLQKWCRLV